MIVVEPWWLFSNVIDAASCARLIEHGLGLDQEEGVIRKGPAEQQRKTRIAWMREPWVYDLVEPWVARANQQAGWNFDVERMQSLQFGVYADSGHYDWHFDMSGRVYAEGDVVAPEFHGLLRKISFSLMLNAGDEYEGGDLEVELGLPTDAVRVERPNLERKRGTMVVFPSFVPHRVTPVTSGVRYSLVGWSCGKPWR